MRRGRFKYPVAVERDSQRVVRVQPDIPRGRGRQIARIPTVQFVAAAPASFSDKLPENTPRSVAT